MLAMYRACERLGMACRTLEIQPLRDQIARAADPRAAMRTLSRNLAGLVRSNQIGRVLSYATAGTVDLGLVPTPDGPATIWNALGVPQSILWTDHPNWAAEGLALQPGACAALGHELNTHWLKSQAAAEEARATLGWRNICAMPVAEDYELLTPIDNVEAVHDVVTIVGSLARLPENVEAFLECDDPDPQEIDLAMVGPVRDCWRERVCVDAPDSTALDRFAADLLERRAHEPAASVWTLARRLEPEYGQVVDWLMQTPRRWYEAEAVLRQAAGWRRTFWTAWLARRVNVGVYGCSSAEIGIDQPAGAAGWVAYDHQPMIYARGKCALNINQSHDQAGATHKPFQIVASGVPCVHHATAELSDLFTPGREIVTFTRGPELLAAVDRLCADPELRASLADRALARARREHTWEHRVKAMLEVGEHAPMRVAG